VVTDGQGTPLNVRVTPGQAHESATLEEVVTATRIGVRSRPGRIVGDKGYDIPRVRAYLRRRGIGAVIPEKAKPHGRKRGRPPVFDRDAYRRRNVVERTIGFLKHARRIATRYEKTAVNFLAMLKLAMIQHYFKHPLRDAT
jgi:transposase